MKKIKFSTTEFLHGLYRQGVQLMAVGLCTGAFAGVVVTFYNIAAEIITKYSANLYEGIRQHPGFIPLLFVILAIAAFMVATLLYFVPMIRGSGIPQTEGASRGLIKTKWYLTLPAMAAGSLFAMFCGLSAGGEGPSMYIGGMCGGGVSRLFGNIEMERRYQITGGACAGLAIAFNAPLTGIIFAFEEAHRRFTPSIFICAFSSVLSGLITRYLLYSALHLEQEAYFSHFTLVDMPLKAYLYVIIAALVCGLLGVAFLRLALLSKKLFAKFTALKGMAKMLVPFMFAGAAGLFTAYAMGGGHSLIEAFGTAGGQHSFNLNLIFGAPLAASIIIIFIIRLIATCLNIGSGVPCGAFIPMLSMGACLGGLMSLMCQKLGMDAAFSDAIVLISLATFFTAAVKSPLTAIVMVLELTQQFTMLVPVILGVSLGYMVSQVFRTEPMYEVLLEQIIEEQHLKRKRELYTSKVEVGSVAAGHTIRDILWPGNLLVRSIKRGDKMIVPSSDIMLIPGDEITAQAEVEDRDDFIDSVNEVIKKRRLFGVFAKKRDEYREEHILKQEHYSHESDHDEHLERHDEDKPDVKPEDKTE